MAAVYKYLKYKDFRKCKSDYSNSTYICCQGSAAINLEQNKIILIVHKLAIYSQQVGNYNECFNQSEMGNKKVALLHKQINSVWVTSVI